MALTLGGALVGEKRLKDERGGNLVDDAAVSLARVAGLKEHLVSFMGGEALIPQMDGQSGELAKLGGEGLRFEGLGPGIAREQQRIADDDCGHLVAAGEAGEGAHIVAGVAFALEGHDGLRGEAKLVGNGDADAAVADVKSEVAGLGLAGQRWLLDNSLRYFPEMNRQQAIRP